MSKHQNIIPPLVMPPLTAEHAERVHKSGDGVTHLYAALIHADDVPGFSISFPDFPGCVSAGDTMEEVMTMGTEALNFHIDCLRNDDMPIPSPRDIATIMADKSIADWWVDVRYIVHIPAFINLTKAA